MFADRAKIVIRSGKGGDGHVSFRRELFVPNGGPDGGDGGRGGDVIFEVDEGLNTLNEFRHKRKYAAQNGEQGGKKRCHGADGKDITLRVPEGTVVYEAESGKVIADMSGENRRQVILKGGRGGKGNMHYATATMQVPKYAQPGQPAQELEVRLELKVIADVGLVGYPNVGKSTFLSRVTNAQPKIANYHFTTLTPNLGVVDLDGADGFVIADIPGLIEGASEGIGLGHAFLRHIERTKVLIHMVDASNPQAEMHMHVVYETLAALDIKDKKIITVFNKTDLIRDQESLVSLKDFRADYTVTASVKQGTGLDALLSTVQTILRANKLLIERVFDYAHAGEIAVIRKYGQLLEERYQEDGIYVKAYIPKDIYARLSF